MISRCRFCFLLLFGFLSSIRAEEFPKVDKKYSLSVCAVFKDEAKILKEWIEYHQLIGVDHFYLYNIASKDRSISVLQPYIRKGIVTLINWYSMPDHEKDDTTWALGIQVPAYEHAAKYRAAKDTKWLVFLEVDEFLVPQEGGKISDLLEKYDEYPGIILKSDYFDASVLKVPPPKLVIETIALTGKADQSLERSVEKTILKPEFCEGFSWPPYKCRFVDGRSAAHLSRKELRINRYAKRNFTDFLFGKIKNKLHIDIKKFTENEIEELLDMGYEIEDQERAIYRFVPELLKKMGYDSGWEW